MFESDTQKKLEYTCEEYVKGQKSVEIDLSNKTEGMYFLKLKGDKKEVVRKVMKR